MTLTYHRGDALATRLSVKAPPLCDMDPKLLSAKQRKALGLMAQGRMYRAKGNRYGHHPMSATLDVVNSLVSLGLARIERHNGRLPYPLLTGAGRAVLDVIEQRRAEP